MVARLPTLGMLLSKEYIHFKGPSTSPQAPNPRFNVSNFRLILTKSNSKIIE